MARPAKAVELRSGHMTKAEKETRLAAESMVKGNADNLSPPDYLTGNQSDIFNRIVENLRDSNILSNLDIFVLTNAAVAIDRIRYYDELSAADNALLLDKDFMANRDRVVKEFQRYINELCLSPQARAKIGSAVLQKKQAAVDPIAEVMKGVGK